ncbi:hypothetical protein [Leptospira alexanderi]|uniref:hypothetical protein n=1 Tax=Leptospira alexanderi TaxID=100053 RepID=UPI0014837810|nr:hypothetical protein [Leptospira alexanderi]
MSVEHSLRRSFSKYTNTDFVILKSTLRTVGDDELNSFQHPVWTRLKYVRGYFDFNSQTETQGAGGERQGYDAVAEILYDDIQSIADQLDQSCRIYKGLFVEENITEYIASHAWRIEKFLPAKKSGNFSVLVVGLKLPEKGNHVFLK